MTEKREFIEPDHQLPIEKSGPSTSEAPLPLTPDQLFAAEVMRIPEEEWDMHQARELINKYAALWELRMNFEIAGKNTLNPQCEIYRHIGNVLNAAAQIMQAERTLQQFPDNAPENVERIVQGTAKELQQFLAPILIRFDIELVRPIDVTTSQNSRSLPMEEQ